MSKRIITSNTWTSKKIRQVQPVEFRPEYAWMMPIFDDNGVAEYDPESIWAVAYAAARPGLGSDKVVQILDEFVRVGLYYRWHDQETGKDWLWLVGSDKPGHLPPPSQRNSTNPKPPIAQAYAVARKNQALPLTGIGIGNGSGNGNGMNDNNNSHHNESENQISRAEILSLLSKLETSLGLTGSVSDLFPLTELYPAPYLEDCIAWTANNSYWSERLSGKTVKDFVRACQKEKAILDQYEQYRQEFKARSGEYPEDFVPDEESELQSQHFIIQED